MANVRHSTVIDVDLATDSAEQKLARLQAAVDRLLSGLSGGLAPTGGGGGSAPNASPGGGRAPGGSPGAPNASPGGGGGGPPPPGLPPAPGGAPAPTPPPPGAAPGLPPGTAPNPTPGAPPGASPAPAPAPAPSPHPGQPAPAPSGGGNGGGGRGGGGGGVGPIVNVGNALAQGGPGMPLSVAQAGAQGLANVAQSVSGAGAALPVGLGLTAAGLGIMLAGLNYRYGVAVRRAGLDERGGALRGLYGGGGYGLGSGYTPEESLGIQEAFARSAGRSDALSGGNAAEVMRLSRSGISPGTMGQLSGLGAAGAGGRGAIDLSAMIGVAQSSGLRGQKAEDYLSRIAAATTQLSESGLTLDMPSTTRFLQRLQTTAGLGGSGLAQARMVTGMAGDRVGAMGQLNAPFQGLGQTVLLGRALREGRTLSEAQAYIETLTLEEQQAMIREDLPGDAAQGVFRSMGLTSGEARGAAGPLGAGYDFKPVTAGPGALKAAYAQSERALVGMVSGKDVGLFKAKTDADAIVMSIGAAGAATVETLREFYTDTMETMEGISGAVGDVKLELNRLTGEVKDGIKKMIGL